MRIRGFLIIAFMIVGVGVTCMGLGWYAGRSGAQQLADLPNVAVTGTPISMDREWYVRLYLGSRISGDPAFTIIAGRVYQGNRFGKPLLTLKDKRVYSGSGPTGPLLYEFKGDRIVEGGTSERIAFVQRNEQIYSGPDPQAPTLFTYEGTRVYWGTPGDGRILATSNTTLDDPDLMKLVSIVLYMQILE